MTRFQIFLIGAFFVSVIIGTIGSIIMFPWDMYGKVDDNCYSSAVQSSSNAKKIDYIEMWMQGKSEQDNDYFRRINCHLWPKECIDDTKKP